MPARIESSFDVPKIWEMVKAAGEKSVRGFLEFELIKLAERINVSGNLTDMQIQTTAEYIVKTYPNETIADFKICFDKASAGAYGKIWKLDGIEVGMWVKSYMEEKYVVLEREMMREKDDHYNQFQSSKKDYLKIWEEAIKEVDKEAGQKQPSRNMSMLSIMRGQWTDKSIEEEGQSKPKHHNYPTTAVSEVRKSYIHTEYLKHNYDARTAEKVEGWLPEDEWYHTHKTEIDSWLKQKGL